MATTHLENNRLLVSFDNARSTSSGAPAVGNLVTSRREGLQRQPTVDSGAVKAQDTTLYDKPCANHQALLLDRFHPFGGHQTQNFEITLNAHDQVAYTTPFTEECSVLLWVKPHVWVESYSIDLKSVMSHLDPENSSQLDTFSVSGGIQSLSFSKGALKRTLTRERMNGQGLDPSATIRTTLIPPHKGHSFKHLSYGSRSADAPCARMCPTFAPILRHMRWYFS
ncbi:hypothetical protein EYF80_031133 [Liparis tanakae]|uniref:Uncharacterized protein n=1 Tax=Liparis tanakae TaxID=230148 RepID=A0A4Z2GZF3_9TELE|nr:hypothetical protein EYF80_031133 [Liparis tanakae]